jgi:hypothetical protein
VFCSMVGGFLGVLGFDESLQVDQAGLPEHAILFEPQIDRPQRRWIEPIKPVTAFAPFLNQMCPS